MLLKKVSLFLPVARTMLYLGAFIFILYAINHPEGGFNLQISVPAIHIVYYCYIAIMFLSLIIGSILLFVKGFDNTIQRLGAIAFLLAVILVISFTILMIVCLFTTISLNFMSFMNINWFFLFGFSLSLLLFVVGIIMSQYSQTK